MATNPPVTIGPFANVPAPGSGVKSDWAQQISTYVAPTAWTAVTFQNGWVNFGGTYQVTQYRKVGDMVQIRGCVKSGTAATAVFTLPAGFRPPADLQFGTSASSVAGTVSVFTTGVVGAGVGGNVFLSLNCEFSVTA